MESVMHTRGIFCGLMGIRVPLDTNEEETRWCCLPSPVAKIPTPTQRFPLHEMGQTTTTKKSASKFLQLCQPYAVIRMQTCTPAWLQHLYCQDITCSNLLLLHRTGFNEIPKGSHLVANCLRFLQSSNLFKVIKTCQTAKRKENTNHCHWRNLQRSLVCPDAPNLDPSRH